MSNSTPRPFAFDTVFDDSGGVAYAPPVRRKHFSAEEIEAARQAGYAEGERSAVARATPSVIKSKFL